MVKLSGGEALIESLVREGVEIIFGLPGVQMYGVVDAIKQNPNIKFLHTRPGRQTFVKQFISFTLIVFHYVS